MSVHATATTAALSALLNSLHTHLQTQTQLLPTLHLQLGLPSSALDDDLKALQEELVKGVENKVDARRREVEEWMERCVAVENECIRYSRALGGNVKATGSSIGELRKESVLPRRYELVTEHQEKSRQLYHTKLEQLTTITNRLHSLAKTLGPKFFNQDILEPTPANGEASLDPNANRDVSSERFLKLEKELVRGKAEVSKRLSQLGALFVQIDWLYSELGIVPPTLEDLDPSSVSHSSTSHSSNFISPISNDPFLDLSTPTPPCRTSSSTTPLFQDESESPEIEYQRIFAQYVARVDEADDETLPENQSVPFGLEDVDPASGLLSWAQSLQASLEDLKRRRESHIQAMYDQLEGLWRRLGIDDADMDAFVENHRGSTEETVQEYEEELERMLELKRDRMGTFIESARQEIVKLWDDLMVGEDERADFAPFADDEHTEELLTIHEDEIRRLKEERRLKAPLLANVRKYFDICDEEKELALAAADQSRLLGRGPRDPGRLLREEKMRKRVSKEKPRLEQDLLASIPAWEQETGRPFLVHGENFLQMLVEAVAAADQENRRKPTRAGSVPPRATTPVSSTSNYVPGSKTGVVTPAVRPSSTLSSHSLPSKRQKLDSVTGSHGTGRTPSFRAGRVPFGDHRGNNSEARPASPSKIPTKHPGSVASSLPRPTPLTMPVPKPGSQHHALGYGRLPTTMTCSTGMRSISAGTKGSSTRVHGRFHNSSKSVPGASSSILKKASRANRESFKPRPSTDAADMGTSVGFGSARWGGGFTVSVKEEEGY